MPNDHVKGDFSQINVLEALPTYPLQAMGDPDHVVYKLICRVKRSAYKGTVPQLDAPMVAGSSGITGSHLPVSDSRALFIGDSGWQHLPHERIEFTRQFATIPRNQTDRFVGSRSWPFPAYRSYVQQTPESENGQLFRQLDLRSSNSNPAPLYKDIQYFLISGTIPAAPAVFRPTEDGNEVDYVTDGGSGTFNGTALNGDAVSDAWAVAATTPSLSQYKAQIAAAQELIIDTAYEQYLGNIHRLVTYKMRAQ